MCWKVIDYLQELIFFIACAERFSYLLCLLLMIGLANLYRITHKIEINNRVFFTFIGSFTISYFTMLLIHNFLWCKLY